MKEVGLPGSLKGGTGRSRHRELNSARSGFCYTYTMKGEQVTCACVQENNYSSGLENFFSSFVDV